MGQHPSAALSRNAAQGAIVDDAARWNPVLDRGLKLRLIRPTARERMADQDVIPRTRRSATELKGLVPVESVELRVRRRTVRTAIARPLQISDVTPHFSVWASN
jgi:hypothetical protein